VGVFLIKRGGGWNTLVKSLEGGWGTQKQKKKKRGDGKECAPEKASLREAG